jgi:hypothetical protein
MLDPKDIIASIQASLNSSNAMQASSTASFNAGVAGYNIAGPANASLVIAGVQGAVNSMVENMNGIKKSIDDQLDAHQKMQKAETTQQFNVNMDDLRPTSAAGFPKEMTDSFFKVFQNK